MLALLFMLSVLINLANTATTKSFFSSRENCKAHGIHLAYGDTIQNIVVVWSTVAHCPSQVKYGTSLWTINNTVPGSIVFFNLTNPDGRHYFHRAELKNLAAGTTYHYKIVNDIVIGPSYYFKIPPNETNWSPSFILYGDLGVESGIHRVLTKEALSGKYSAFFHIGDLAYDLHSDGGKNGDNFMDVIQDYARYIPYMTCPGNHEIDNGTFAQYRYRFSMPQTSWPMTLDRMWYSLDIGPVHFISFSTEVFFTNGGIHTAAQSAWLVNDLKKANDQRDQRPWIVAYGHRPMYCSNSDQDDCTHMNSTVRTHLENIFYINGVDVILEAHEHSYERLYPVYDGKVLAHNYTDPQAPIHIITGAAGNKQGEDPMNGLPVNKTSSQDNTLNNTANWTAFRQSEGSLNSYGKFTVYNSSHLYWEQIQKGKVLDSIWIVKYKHTKNNVSKEFQEKVVKKIMEEASKTTSKTTSKSKTTPSSHHFAVSFSPSKGVQTLIIALSVAGGAALVIITIVIVIRSSRNRKTAINHWNESAFVKKSFYRNIQNLENELMCDDLDVTDGTLPTSKLLSEHSDI